MKLSHLFKLTLCAASFMCGVWSSTAETNPPAASDNTKPCFNCKGTGTAKCSHLGCSDGKVDCPTACIKLRKGVWIKRPELHRPDPNETLQYITVSGHKFSVSSHHEGVYYVWQGDHPEMLTCPTCNGLTRVNCPACKGKGTAACSICDGKKVVPESWTAFDNPKMKNRPFHYKLKDGREIVGREVMSMGDTATIRTQDGDVKINKADIISDEKPSTTK